MTVDTQTAGSPVVQLREATLSFGQRTLWSGLDLDLERGEFVAVLGSNGSGKTALLRVLLGLQPLSGGSATVLGRPVRRGNRRIGYIPQQRLAEDGLPLRARDLVGLGVDGHRFGLPWPSATKADRVDRLLADVGAGHLATVPIGQLSGGEQQRVRVAQAIAAEPEILLCDEPLIALDLRHQRSVAELIDAQRIKRNLGVLFVTHDVNPILGMVDRILYLAGGQFRIGTPTEVLNSHVLSELYQSPVDVIHTGDRVVVVGTPDGAHTHPDNPYEPHHAHADEVDPAEGSR